MPSKPSPYEVRPGTDDDIAAVIELMRVSLGEGRIPRTREFWTWKHRENPFGASPMWLALAENKVIGVRLFMRWAFNWNHARARVAAVRAVDTATHPDWQGKGIFKRLTLGLVEDVTNAGVSFVFNTPNEKSRPGYLKMGWQQVGRISLWVKPCRPLSALKKTLFASVANDATLADDVEPSRGPNPAAEQLLKAAQAASLFARAGERPGAYATPLSEDYLRWRYLNCPAATYDLSSVDPARALLVQRLRQRRSLQELAITDLVVERSLAGLRAAAASLNATIARARPDYVVTAMRHDAPEIAVLLAAGFVPAPRLGPILTVRPLNPVPAGPDLLLPGSFQTSIGDLELF
jgi:GNAT superfamily N-acetyltransferase